MQRKIEKITAVNAQKLHDIRELFNTCVEYDHYEAKMYWNIIANRKTSTFNDFFYYSDTTLLGYMGVFLFQYEEVEINALVHPQFREQGIFKSLFEDVKKEVCSWGVDKYLFICPQDAFPAKQVMDSMQTTYVQSEYYMKNRDAKIASSLLPNLSLYPATPADLTILATIDANCFGNEFETVLSRYAETIDEKNRLILLAKLDNKVIGKIHIRFDKDTSFIHDFCILPEYQGKGYGTALLKNTMNTLIEEHYTDFSLEVLAANKNALKLYEKADFAISQAQDYYRLKLNETAGFFERLLH